MDKMEITLYQKLCYESKTFDEFVIKATGKSVKEINDLETIIKLQIFWVINERIN